MNKSPSYSIAPMSIVIPDLNSTVKWSAKNGNLLNELFNQSLIKLCNIGFLPGDEVLQFLNPVHGFFLVMAVELGLFLLVAEPENFVSDGIVVLFVICFLDELFLQFFKPFA